MQIVLTRDELKELAQTLAPVCGRKASLPVLEHVRFRAADGGIAVHAANLTEEVAVRLPERCAAEPLPVPFLLPFADLKALASDLGVHDTAVVDPDTERGRTVVRLELNLEGRRMLRRIEVMPPDEFPEPMARGDERPCNAAALIEAAAALTRLASADENRSVLHSVFVHAEGRCLAATDGRRACRLPLEDWPFADDAILPATAFLARWRPKGEGAVGCLTREGLQTVSVRVGRTRWTVRCVEGTYPDYRRVFPALQGDWRATVRIAPEDLPPLRTAARRWMKFGDGSLCLYAALGKAFAARHVHPAPERELLPLDASACEAVEAVGGVVNPAFLLDALDLGFTELRLGPPDSPWLCTRPGDTAGDTCALHVIMPLRDGGSEAEAAYRAAVSALNGWNGTVPEPDPAGVPAAIPQPMDTAAEPIIAASAAVAGAGQETVPMNDARDPESPAAAPCDPSEAFRTAMDEADAAVRSAAAAVQAVRSRFRLLEKDLKAREKRCAVVEKSLVSLQQAVGF